jgi:hypothetical protein
MESFTLEQLGLFITLMGGTLSAIIIACFKSRCRTINTPCLSCNRDVLPPVNNDTVEP